MIFHLQFDIIVRPKFEHAALAVKRFTTTIMTLRSTSSFKDEANTEASAGTKLCADGPSWSRSAVFGSRLLCSVTICVFDATWDEIRHALRV